MGNNFSFAAVFKPIYLCAVDISSHAQVYLTPLLATTSETQPSQHLKKGEKVDPSAQMLPQKSSTPVFYSYGFLVKASHLPAKQRRSLQLSCDAKKCQKHEWRI